jgi:hypothetical protein
MAMTNSDWLYHRLFSHPLMVEEIEDHGSALAVPDDLLEMKTMLSTLRETWKQEWLAEGEARGRAESLIRLTEKRFGPMSPELREKIMGADAATIDQWFDRAIDAPDLHSVFDSIH